jgi:hypothetical protein
MTTSANQVVARQIDRSANTLLLALEPIDSAEFFAPNHNGFSAAWVVGHLSCVADLFSSWLDNDGGLLLDPEFHAVFNETAVTEAGTASKVAGISQNDSKEFLLLQFRLATVKALRVLRDFKEWDQPAPADVPASLLTCGAVWELLAVHIYWHLGELSGSMPRFFGTYTLNTLPHYVYVKPV